MVELRNAPTQARSRRTLDAIMAAADKLFAERGVSETTNTEIAELAGVSIGSLYRFFPNKGALVDEYVQRYAEGLINRMPASVPENPSLDVLDDVVSALVDRSIETRMEFRGYGSVRVWRNPDTGALASDPVHNAELAMVSGLLESSIYKIDPSQIRRMTTVIVDGTYPLLEGFGELSVRERKALALEIKAMVSSYIRDRIDTTKLKPEFR